MIRYECDKCGVAMAANDPQRYIVRLEVFAAAGHIDLGGEVEEEPGTALSEVIRDLSQADPDEVEDQTYRLLRFDLCNACRRHLLAHPLERSVPIDPTPDNPAT